MTSLFEELQESPIVVPQSGSFAEQELTPDEWEYLRKLQVDWQTKATSDNTPGQYINDVYYLAGDERRAVQTFVEANRDALESINLSANRNVLQTALSRELYDLVLEELGERSIRKYQSVVVEERRDGPTWMMERDAYERSRRQYTIGGSHQAARLSPGTTLEEIYQACPTVITYDDLRAQGVEGSHNVVLQFYLDCGLYDCTLEAEAAGSRGMQIRKCTSD